MSRSVSRGAVGVVQGVLALGAVVIVIAAFAFTKEKTASRLWLIFASALFDLIYWLLTLVTASRSRRRLAAFVAPAMCVAFAVAFASEFAGTGRPGGVAAISVAIVAFFVLPLPLLLALYMRLQDELQRSLLAESGAIALAALIVSTIGYWVLQRISHLPPIAPWWLASAAAGLWALVWLLLRLRTR